MPDTVTQEQDFYVVAIGSSAGGLEATRDLVRNLSADVPAAYVIVQHMSPQHKSLLATLISRETHLSVADVTDGVEPELHKVYVTPPNHDVLFKDGALRLVDPSREPGAPKPSIDRFFITLAEDRGDYAVGVILSGTGSDGAYGVQAVRGNGGITIAQDTETAKYDRMPRAAVDTGCVDLILTPADIGEHLSKILTKTRDFSEFTQQVPDDSPNEDLLQMIFAKTRVDFREYKPTTVQRRIERRMSALNIADRSDYTQYCRVNPAEVDALYKDLLISVTRFFRDASEFEALAEVLDGMVGDGTDRPLRIWIPGCATGEEVYSVAILLAEALGGPRTLMNSRIQFFATDIDAAALVVARRGWYSYGALADLPKPFLEKYFTPYDEGWQVSNALRDVILFSTHNVCQDPPFLNIDLLCCRNVMIYFGIELQQRVLSRFHYALTPNGHLFLGTAETINGSDDIFVKGHERAKLYKKRMMTGRLSPSRQQPFRVADQITPSRDVVPQAAGIPEISGLFDALARQVGSNAVLADSEHRIVRVFGDMTDYIQFNERDRLTLSLSLLRAPFANEVRTLVTLALKHNERRAGRAHRLRETDTSLVWMEATPLKPKDGREALVLLSFVTKEDEAEPERRNWRPSDVEDADTAAYIEKLEHEITSTREALQQTVEQVETSNEELQSLNEELQSTNEELQATNEELETSNEEMQSTNEELVTVNEELQINSSDLAMMTDELEAVLRNIGAPVLVVDTALQLSRASQAARVFFKITSPIVRPHISQISVPEDFPSLADLCNECITLGKAVTTNVQTDDSRFTLNCTPFSDSQGRIQGASIIFSRSDTSDPLLSEVVL